jgi:hypothetical protein
MQAIENKGRPMLLIDTRRGLGAPSGMTSKFPFSSLVSRSPAHPYELKSTQPIEDKRPVASQSGTHLQPWMLHEN